MISVGVVSCVGAVNAQTFPSRTLRAIVPYAPGGSTDVVMRILAPRMSELLGQQVVVENRPGGSSTIGLDLAAKAPPDGHTLGIANLTFVANPSLIKKMPFDSAKDLAPVSFMSLVTFALSVHPSVPAKTVKDLIALARAQPGALNYASAGNVSANHLASERFNFATGIKMTHVPYKGGGPAVIEQVAGHVQLAFLSAPAVVPYIKSGRLRALAVTNAKRSQVFPDLPTIAEAALPGYESEGWTGIFTPARTPAAVVQRLQGEFANAVRDSDIRTRLLATGTEPAFMASEAFGTKVRDEIARWGKVVKASGMRVD